MKSVYKGSEKVAEFDNYSELRVGGNKPAFIYEGSDLVYPNPVKDGLVLWYDFSGRTNADSQRGIAEDLSGNGNHGTLQNFNYTAESGYDKNKLLFDGVDDVIDSSLVELNVMDSTYECVVYYDRQFEGQVYQTILATHSFWADGLFFSGNAIRGYINNGVGGFNVQYIPSDSKMYVHVVRVVDSKRLVMELYVDGNIVGSINIQDGAINTRGEQLTVSALAYPLRRPIHSTKIYNRPLTPEEIAHNYAIEKERFGIE